MPPGFTKSHSIRRLGGSSPASAFIQEREIILSTTMGANHPSKRTLRFALGLGLVLAGVVSVAWIYPFFASVNQAAEDLRAPVTIKWSTRREERTAGYLIYRAETSAGPFLPLNHALIPASNDPYVGGTYLYTDTQTIPGITYYYQLEQVAVDGKRSREDPIAVTARLNSPTIFGWALPQAAFPIMAALFGGMIVSSVFAVWRLGR